MKFKQIKFTDKQQKRIQDYANKNCNGNFNEAVRLISDLWLEHLEKLSNE